MVFDEPTTWSGDGQVGRTSPIGLGEHRRARARGGAATWSVEGGSSGRKAMVERPAPRGSERATSGTSSMPCAISSEPPPMSKSRMRSADQPYQRRTARNVSRASSSPESTCSSTPVSPATRASTASPFAASRMAEVAKASSSSMPASRAASAALADRGEDRRDALVADGAVGLEVAHEPQHRLVRRGRGSGGRRGGRRRRAGARCWNRRRGPRGACCERNAGVCATRVSCILVRLGRSSHFGRRRSRRGAA